MVGDEFFGSVYLFVCAIWCKKWNRSYIYCVHEYVNFSLYITHVVKRLWDFCVQLIFCVVPGCSFKLIFIRHVSSKPTKPTMKLRISDSLELLRCVQVTCLCVSVTFQHPELWTESRAPKLCCCFSGPPQAARRIPATAIRCILPSGAPRGGCAGVRGRRNTPGLRCRPRGRRDPGHGRGRAPTGGPAHHGAGGRRRWWIAVTCDGWRSGPVGLCY